MGITKREMIISFCLMSFTVFAANLQRNEGFANGRFSACTDIIKQVNASAEVFNENGAGLVTLQCVKEKDATYITSAAFPDRKMTLDGQMLPVTGSVK